MGKKTIAVEGTRVFRHRYGWTTEEKSVITVLVLLGVAALVVAAMNTWTPGWLIIGGVCWFFAGYSFWLGNDRKTKSTMTATYNEKTTDLSIDGNKYEGINNHVELSGVNSVKVRQLGGKAVPGEYVAKDVLLFYPPNGGKAVTMPIRMLANKELDALLKPLIDEFGIENAKIAAEFGRNYKG